MKIIFLLIFWGVQAYFLHYFWGLNGVIGLVGFIAFVYLAIPDSQMKKWRKKQ